MKKQERTVIFRPYYGAEFILDLSYRGGVLRYSFRQNNHVIFSDTYRVNVNIWSNETVRDVVGPLTVAPGDVDPEYFDQYSQEQLIFCRQYGGLLAEELVNRFN